MSKNVLIYDPYLSTLGGGERYIFMLAQYFREHKGYHVTIAAPELPDPRGLKDKAFSEDFELKELDLSEYTSFTKSFDVVIYLTNDIPPLTLCRQSFAMVQFPFTTLAGPRSLRERLNQERRLHGYTYFSNSKFTAVWLRRRWHRRSAVIFPPVRLGSYDSAQKTETILAVGRFFPGGHCKRQDTLIDAYKQLPAARRKQWRLILAGGLTQRSEDMQFAKALQESAKGYAIEFAFNTPQARLENLYGQASIFWHATGYGRSAEAPEKAEHFGMTTVEAMSWGCVPLAYQDGGQVDIIKPGFGRLWQSPSQLAEQTEALIESSDLPALAAAAAFESQQYGFEQFWKACAEFFSKA